MNLNSIGKNIRKYRTAKGLRQEDIAERAGLSTNYVGMIERGEKIPSLETFINIILRYNFIRCFEQWLFEQKFFTW